jgi:erythromycin esterase-like protein
MSTVALSAELDVLNQHAISLDNDDALLAMIGNARIVLLGEASHGTSEFYRARARLTQRLITEKGFHAVAVEADWPDAHRVNNYVRGLSSDADATAALDGFLRFPTWMWRNTDVVEFVEWQRTWNARQARKTGFYGLDLYSLFTSIDEVLQYLGTVDPALQAEARARYSCFDHYGDDTQHYGYAAGIGLSESCQEAVVAQLCAMQARGCTTGDPFFAARQNARLVKNAEEYYRTMFRGRVASWNLRDQHMAETLDELALHLTRELGEPARIVIWAHNSHVGDARATETGQIGELNVGQLARERYGENVRLIGFSTYEGWVTAASGWDEPGERLHVRPALEHSYEELFHQLGREQFGIIMRGNCAVSQALSEGRLQRAIGVIYQPRTERQSHYFHTRLPQQFDAILHFDVTNAVTPLESSGRRASEPPETYPSGV